MYGCLFKGRYGDYIRLRRGVKGLLQVLGIKVSGYSEVPHVCRSYIPRQSLFYLSKVSNGRVPFWALDFLDPAKGLGPKP